MNEDMNDKNDIKNDKLVKKFHKNWQTNEKSH